MTMLEFCLCHTQHIFPLYYRRDVSHIDEQLPEDDNSHHSDPNLHQSWSRTGALPHVMAALFLLCLIGCNQDPDVSEFAREVWAPTICAIEERCCGTIPDNCQSSKSLKFIYTHKERSRKYGAEMDMEEANACTKAIKEMTCSEWSLAQERTPSTCSAMFSYSRDLKDGEVCESGWQCESGVCLRDPVESTPICTAYRQDAESCHTHQNCDDMLACIGLNPDTVLGHCETGVPGEICENDFDCASDECSEGSCTLACRLSRVF